MLQLLLLLVLPASAICAEPRVTVIEVDTKKQRLELFLYDDKGKPFGTFYRLSKFLASKNQKLLFAMNAGMYQVDRSPVGLYIENGRTYKQINMRSGTTNFTMKPNGVFAVSANGPMVVESNQYKKLKVPIRIATQSGPMLVIDGKINPKFSVDSQSKFIRNGVCVIGSKAFFAISETRVNFYEFARYFKEKLNCKNALYFDGNVSSLYSVDLKRSDLKVELGPIIAVTQKVDD